mmetsp:Transcript_72414/g.186788  ORF Transcript_72414/g.186788 Transcript_72414/m.186788 type:complete len:277 (+) Transcript_72414:262-1092(+)
MVAWCCTRESASLRDLLCASSSRPCSFLCSASIVDMALAWRSAESPRSRSTNSSRCCTEACTCPCFVLTSARSLECLSCQSSDCPMARSRRCTRSVSLLLPSTASKSRARPVEDSLTCRSMDSRRCATVAWCCCRRLLATSISCLERWCRPVESPTNCSRCSSLSSIVAWCDSRLDFSERAWPWSSSMLLLSRLWLTSSASSTCEALMCFSAESPTCFSKKATRWSKLACCCSLSPASLACCLSFACACSNSLLCLSAESPSARSKYFSRCSMVAW